MWSAEDEPNEWAAITAVVVRVAALLNSDIAGLVEVNNEGDGEVPIACWRKASREVWVWDLAHHSELDVVSGSSWPRQAVLDAVRSDPLSKDCVLVPGPPFASLGLPAAQSASSIPSPSRLVTVFDCDLHGVQVYGFSDQDKTSTEAIEAYNRVLEAASLAEDANMAARQARERARQKSPFDSPRELWGHFR